MAPLLARATPITYDMETVHGVDEPSINEPDVDEPSIDQPTIDQPTIDQPTIDQPSIDQPSIDQPSVDEPDVDEPSIDEPSLDEPSVDEPSIDEPSLDEPSVDEPNIDELPIPREPVDDQAIGAGPTYYTAFVTATHAPSTIATNFTYATSNPKINPKPQTFKPANKKPWPRACKIVPKMKMKHKRRRENRVRKAVASFCEQHAKQVLMEADGKISEDKDFGSRVMKILTFGYRKAGQYQIEVKAVPNCLGDEQAFLIDEPVWGHHCKDIMWDAWKG
ncbi:MAG: hypothetical protein Q9190_006533, partial [Brigantiaea leucoxantha]